MAFILGLSRFLCDGIHGRKQNGARRFLNRDVLLVVKGVLYLVDLWLVETGLEHDEPGVPKDIR